MADQTGNNPDERDRVADDPERRPAMRGASLAEEGGDDLPAFLIIPIGIAVIAALLAQGFIDLSPSTPTETVTAIAADDADADESDDHADDTEADDDEAETEGDDTDGEAALDLTALGGELDELGLTGVTLSAEGGVVTAIGEVADDAERESVITLLSGAPGVESVVDELTLAEAPEVTGSAVGVDASQASVVLSGTVPSEDVHVALVERVAAIYSADQIDDQLLVDPAVQPPVEVTITGSVTDPVLHQGVSAAFADLAGVESVVVDGFTLEESSDLEASLNSLAPIEFDSGSAAIVPASAPIVDEAAQFLLANPGTNIEIGGHTDSRGGPEGNQTLSQARADAVLAALVERGVPVETMEARGFGETRLKVNPDDTLEAQQANRRIEFRIITE